MSKRITMGFLLVVTALVAGGVSHWLSRSTQADVRVTVESIRKVAELATVEYRLAAIVEKKYHSDLWIFGDVESDHLFGLYTGAVRGRVDLENATVDIQNEADGDYVSIHFKRGSVLISGVEIDPEKDHFELISIEGRSRISFTAGATDGQRKALQQVALREIRESAIKTGIVEKTMSNAITVLSDFLGALGYRATVTFDEDAYDPSAS